MTQRIEEVIEKFLVKKENNKNGVIYNAVNIEDRTLVKDVLTKFYLAFQSLFDYKDDAEELFCERLERLNAIRFDNKDENLYPFKYSYDAMRKEGKGKLNGGITSINDEGVFIVDMDFMTKSIDESIHTLIHELVHLMATVLLTKKDGTNQVKTGLKVCSEEDFMKFLNEGFTELIAQILWSKMYPNKKCPGIGRYGLYVDSVKLILKQFVNKEQIIEDYIVDARQVVDILKNQVDVDNNDMFTFVKNASKQDLKNLETRKEIAKNIKKFIYTNKSKII